MIKHKETGNLLHVVVLSREILLLLLPSAGHFTARNIRHAAGVPAMLSLSLSLKM